MIRKAEGFQSEKIIVLPRYQLEELAAHPLIRQIHMTDIGYYPRAANHFRERTHGCDSHIVIYCASGRGWIRLGDGNPVQVAELCVVILPAGVPHAYGADAASPWSIYWFHLRGEQAGPLLAGIDTPGGVRQLPSAADGERLVELFHQCYDLLSARAYSLPHQLHVSHTVRYLISYIGLLPERPAIKSQAYIEQAMLLMQERLESHVTIEELVTYTRISKQHLNHLFKQHTGFAPIDYYLRLKMQRACQLLDLTDDSVKSISLTLGMTDPYYFSRLFKQIIGVSPSSYRDKLKG